MPAYRGRDVVVIFAGVDISGDGRSLSYNEVADALDSSKYGLDRKTKIAGLEDGSGTFDGLDSTGDWTAAWEAIAAGAEGTLQIRPEGTGGGNREFSVSAVVTSRSLDTPYDNLSAFSMAFEMSGEPTEGTQ